MDFLNFFSLSARSSLNRAREIALEHGHCEIEPEHILLAFIKEPKSSAYTLLGNLAADLPKLELRLEGMLAQVDIPKGAGERPGFSRRTMLLLNQAFQELTRTKESEVTPEHILISLDFERFGNLSRLLNEFNIKRDLMMIWLSSERWRAKDASEEGRHEVAPEDTWTLTEEEIDAITGAGGASAFSENPLLDLIMFTSEPGILKMLLRRLGKKILHSPGTVLPEHLVAAVLASAIETKDSLVDDLESMGIDTRWAYLRLRMYNQSLEISEGGEEETTGGKAAPKRKLLGEILIEQRFILPEQLEHALNVQHKKSQMLGETLVDLGYCSPEQVTEALAQQMGVELFDVERARFDKEAIETLSPEEMDRLSALPYLLIDEEDLMVVMDDPTDRARIEEIERITGKKVIPVIGTKDDIAKTIPNLEELPLRREGEWELHGLKYSYARREPDAPAGLDLRWSILKFWRALMATAAEVESARISQAHILSVFLGSKSQVAARIRRKFKLKKADIAELARGSIDALI